MIYLDYSATTPANKEVVDTFSKVSLNYIGNPNSLHKLGVEARKLMDASTNQVKLIILLLWELLKSILIVEGISLLLN